MAQDTIVKTDSVRTAILTNLNNDIAELFTDVAGKAAAAHTHGGAGTVSFSIGTNASRLLASPTADLIWYADDTGLWWFYDFSITTWSQLVASATVPGVVELATDAEVVTGTDTARAVTPAGLQSKVASATAKGIVELATDAETITGTDTGRACTPANIQAKVASATAKGIVELATDAETVTGTDTTRACTPANVQAKLDNDAYLKTDGTAGRTIRTVRLQIANGSNAATLKCQTADRWNGDTIGNTDNIAKNATTGNFSLNANGSALTIEASGITNSCVAVFSAVISRNISQTDITVDGYPSNNDIALVFYDTAAGDVVDLTTLVDTGEIFVEICYITS